MTPERWQYVSRVFEAVLERPPAERESLLKQTCGDDLALLRDVESLLAQEAKAAVVDRPMWDMAAGVLDPEPVLSAGTSVGNYRCIEMIGAGGMGTVYRARDTRLHRDVALKVLPSIFVDDENRLSRFRREAHVLASLNHSNIAAIYGFEDAGDVHALVLELINGPTLAERLRRGRIPVREALAIATQIAEGLVAAHDVGIVHRDLKPANIKIREDGTVKLLDFGLAKPLERVVFAEDQAGDSLPPLDQPTADHAHDVGRMVNPEVTSAGSVLGTLSYMSPEQLAGQPADKRSDIWAFGCVLYEMLTRKRAFDAASLAVARQLVMESEPDWDALPRDVAPAVVTLIKRCLVKDRRDRTGDMSAAVYVLRELPDASGVAVPASRRVPLWAAVVAASVLLTAGVTLWDGLGTPAPAAPRMHLLLGFGDKLELKTDLGAPFDLSPDGTHVAFIANADEGQPSVYLRDLARSEAVLLPGTEGARDVFFSPDGRWLGFTTVGAFRKVALTGGVPIDIVRAPNDALRSTWSDDGSIYFGLGAPGWGIRRITPDGKITNVTEPNRAAGELSHRWPQLLPDGKGLLFTAIDASSQASVMVQPPSGDPRPLVRNASGGRFVPPDRLLYQHNGALYVVPFSVGRLQVAGPAAQVLEQVGTTNTAGPLYAVSVTGTLIAVASAAVASTQFVVDWTNPSGALDPLLTGPQLYGSMQFSPDANTLALHVLAGQNDIWLYDLRRQLLTPLTVEPGEDRAPVWSPDGRWIAFASRRGGADSNIWLMRADRSGKPIRLTTCECFQYPTSWHPNGRFLAITHNNPARVPQSRPGNGSDVSVLPLPDYQSDSLDSLVREMPQPFAATPFQEAEGAFSLDGQWLAYESGESQTREVWVQAFPGPGQKVQISSGGGTFPVWAPDGRRLFYYGSDRRIWTADFTVKAGIFRPGKARRWSDAVVEERAAPRGRNFAVSKAGDRIAVFRKPPSQAAQPITNLTVVTNAFAGRDPTAFVK